jgi:hypothetical protein
MARALLERIFAGTCFDKGREVPCADNFSIGTRRNTGDLVGDKRFELLRHN